MWIQGLERGCWELQLEEGRGVSIISPEVYEIDLIEFRLHCVSLTLQPILLVINI